MTIPLKLMNEYCVDFPVWSAVGDTLGGRLPLSAELDARLRAWAAFFNAHHDWQTGWDVDRAEVQAHATEGRALQEALARELGTGYSVTLDLWEVPRRGRLRALFDRSGR